VFLSPDYDVRVLTDRCKVIGNKGRLDLPSANVQIVARTLQCDAPSCVIDVSGMDAPTVGTNNPARNGTQQGWPRPGINGTDGE
jgi:hypothetical protein